MRNARVSIGRLMVVIILIAIASAALFRPTRLWAATVFGATVLSLSIVTLSAIFGRKQTRVSLAAFAIGGWLSMMIHFSPFFTWTVGTSSSSVGESSNLGTTAILDMLYPMLVEVPAQTTPGFSYFLPTAAPAPSQIVTVAGGPGAAVSASIPVAPPAPSVVFPPSPQTLSPYQFWTEIDQGTSGVVNLNGGMPLRSPSFLTIGYSIFTLLFALLASLIACWIHASSKATEPGTSEMRSPEPASSL